jgi:hypothetical protein
MRTNKLQHLDIALKNIYFAGSIGKGGTPKKRSRATLTKPAKKILANFGNLIKKTF